MGKNPLFHLIIAAGPIQPNADGIGALLRAIVTFFEPALASASIEIGTVARKGPAVVQRPQDGLVHSMESTKDHRQVQVAAVQVMQMNDVRVKPLHIPDKSPRAKHASVALRVQQLSHGRRAACAPRAHPRGRHRAVLRAQYRHAIANSAFAPVGFHQPGDIHRNAACAFDPAVGVKLKNPHSISLPQAK